MAKVTTPAADGAKHYTMVDVAVTARKRGLGEGDVRHLAERVGIVSGVPMADPGQQRHLAGIVAWTMRNIQPEEPSSPSE
jgi:hypothetical protein